GRRNGTIVSKRQPRCTDAEDGQRGDNREPAWAACAPGCDVCAHCQPASRGNLGVKGRRRDKRQKHHGPHDACCRAGLKAAYPLRRTRRRQGDGGVGGTYQSGIQRRVIRPARDVTRLTPRKTFVSLTLALLSEANERKRGNPI